jgi:sirohydrochlorin cobaltochelatase
LEALILFSHGSVLCGAAETLKEHARRLEGRGRYALVEVGFLNYSEPLFAEAAACCHEAGATTVTVVPYFLVPGKFVRVDLPAQIEAVRQRWPEMEFRIAQPIGFDTRLADALLELAAGARTSEQWRDDLDRASEFCEADPQCPLYGTPCCPRVPYGKAACSPPRAGAHGATEPGPAATPKAALLVLVHGSPRTVANAPMFEVLEEVRGRGVYPIVEAGFMECNQPDIPAAIESCLAQGATEVVAVPYFLHTGNHVADDLPTLLEEAQARHPGVAFRMGDFLGRAPQLTDILFDRASRA